MAVVLDWSGTQTCAPQPCVDCGHPAGVRDPSTSRPRHKVCAERAAGAGVSAPAVAALGPERQQGRARLAPLREGQAFDVGRFRDLLAVWPSDPYAASQQDEPCRVPDQAVPVVMEAQRGVQPGDALPPSCKATRAALQAAGWQVQATCAVAATAGVEHRSVALWCIHPSRGRAWCWWVDGAAQGGTAHGCTGVLGITAWRLATGSAPVPKVARKAAPVVPTLLF